MAKKDIFTVDQVARAVFGSDGYKADLNVEQLGHIIELALKNCIGQNCFMRAGVAIDLNNGRLLRCTLEPK